MLNSSWNDTNQHWIPQFLLKGFGIKGRTSHVYDLDKKTNTIESRHVSEVASKQRLLTDKDDALMREIERDSTTMIASIRKGNLSIRERDRQIIDALVWALMRNDPYSGFDEEGTRQQIVGSLGRKIEDAFRRHGGSIAQQDLEDYIQDRLPHDYLAISMAASDSTVRKALRLMGLRVLQPVGGGYFVIGDSPVLVVRGVVEGVRSLLNPGSQVVLPIGSRCLLVYDWETPTNIVQSGGVASVHQIRSLYDDYYYKSNCTHLYGRNHESLSFYRKLRLQWQPQERSTKVAQGWVRMQAELLMESKLREVEEAESEKVLDAAAFDLLRRARADFDGRDA